jgi:peptidoglycan-associated lipoprotein
MSSLRRVAMTAAVLSLLGAMACRKKPAPAPAPAPPPPPPAAPAPTGPSAAELAAERARADSIARANAAAAAARAREDSIANANRLRAAETAESNRLRDVLLAVVQFDYNVADLRDDTRAALEAKVPILVRNTDVRIEIGGHADNRGSDTYNLALAQRRAATVRDFLTSRNIDASRLTLVSFGEERPLCQEDTEACWARNRRAEFRMTAGGAMLRR